MSRERERIDWGEIYSDFCLFLWAMLLLAALVGFPMWLFLVDVGLITVK